VSSGAVLVDGVDVRAMAQVDLRARIGFVSQRAALFSGSVASNIAYGRADADDAAIARATRIAQATDFVEAYDDGYAHEIAQGGGNLSGGQKQRLSIARAIARDPDIFVFDDSFSALDARTDARLRAALAAETGGKTVLIVAQRIGTIMHADQIVVLDEGRVACIGQHGDLVRTCREYRDIAASQLTEAELATSADAASEVAR
jgi:ATP-binding cassette subfamily B protein